MVIFLHTEKKNSFDLSFIPNEIRLVLNQSSNLFKINPYVIQYLYIPIYRRISYQENVTNSILYGWFYYLSNPINKRYTGVLF